MSRGCLWRPGPAPCYQDWVSSPALGILAVPGESAGQGLGPISSGLAHALPLGLHPWEQGEKVPSDQIPSWRSLLAVRPRMQSKRVPPPGLGPGPAGCLMPTPPAPAMLLLLHVTSSEVSLTTLAKVVPTPVTL